MAECHLQHFFSILSTKKSSLPSSTILIYRVWLRKRAPGAGNLPPKPEKDSENNLQHKEVSCPPKPIPACAGTRPLTIRSKPKPFSQAQSWPNSSP